MKALRFWMTLPLHMILALFDDVPSGGTTFVDEDGVPRHWYR